MSQEYRQLLHTCRAITSEPMAYVVAWKGRNPNGKAVGFFPTHVPTEIIYALGGLPVGLWGGDIVVDNAYAHIQQFTCSIVRSTTEYALAGSYDILDAVLFPPICDSVKLVASIWSLNLSNKFLVDMVNLPERLDSPASIAYLAAELRRVTSALEHRFDVVVSEDALRDAIISGNRLRAAYEAFCAWRLTSIGAAVTLAEASTILKAGTIMHCDDYCPLIEKLVHSVTGDKKPAEGVPVIVTGLACQLPHPDFLALFETAGLRVLEDDLFLGMRAAPAVTSDGDPYINLAQGFVRSKPMATRHHGLIKRHELLLERIRHVNAKAVIFLVPKFCEPEWFDLRVLQAQTKEALIPSLVIDFEEGPGTSGQVQTRLEAFAETLVRQRK